MMHLPRSISGLPRLPLLLLTTLALLGGLAPARGEAMLQLFNMNWDELIQKMPEIAEAGYTSLWLPPPAKAGSVYSVGYDLFDPFDLGDKNQRGTVRTKYGTKAQLLQVMELAHRFGLRVYFDNIMNHRGFDVPGYNASTPTNLYPGMVQGDFHLQTVGSYFQNWPSISTWDNVWQVQNQPLFGLVDIANEPGTVNANFGASLGNTITKPSLVRQPANREYYMDTAKPAISGPWRPFNGPNGVPVAEDVGAYLIRSALWMLNETKCDGFRFDAVKHVPATFFGAAGATPDGYTGGIQAMFDYVHGYGTNAVGNGYLEADDSRNSCFDTEVPRNDAMLFGEHLGEPPSFQEYLLRGMRLLNSPYHFQLNNILGNPSASLVGLDQRNYTPPGSSFAGPVSVLFAQSHDDGTATHRELQHAYNFFREGLPSIYSDAYNWSSAPAGQEPFPRIAYAPYLGEYGDNKMPDLATLHQQLARGGTRPRWSDTDVVAFERYDYREVPAATAFTNPEATVLLFAMSDNYASAISFDDGVAQKSEGTFYECFPVASSKGQGLVVGFPPGSVIYQLSDSPDKATTCARLLVRQATASATEAATTASDANPVNRKVFVGKQAIAPGGGAIELKIPAGSYVAYAYQGPQASRAALKDAISFRQGGADVPKVTIYRHDGVNGDSGFNPTYPFKMRGRVDASGNVVGGVHISNLTYAIEVPVLTNAPFDVVVRSDASTVNTLLKLDGGTDLNSQMGLAPTNGFDRRDNRPGYATDNFLGYEQALWRSRFGPEKFAARDVSRNNVTSAGAETYYYTAGGTNGPIINGAGNGAAVLTQTATNVLHNPALNTSVVGQPAVTQRNPLSVPAGQAADVWVKVWIKFRINRCFLYYTTDGSNPEGSFGVGLGTTRVIEGGWAAADSADSNIDWWKVALPAQLSGVQVRYKVALFHDNIPTISDADDAKAFGLTQFGVSGFNPTTATVWLHNDLNTNNTATGLREGFHIVRARTFLPRDGKAGVYNTFAQTFYYDAQLPTGVVAYPQADGSSIGSGSYELVLRTDAMVTGVEVNLQDSNPLNDDSVTAQNNGNGPTNGAAKFASARQVSPNSALDAQYPNLPLEWRFNYVNVPSSGTATISARLSKLTTTVNPSSVTTLSRSVATLAPTQVLQIVSPAVDGQVFPLGSNSLFTIQACFTSTLTTNDASLFSLYINGTLQPRQNYIFRPTGCGAGLRAFYYNWTTAVPGSNVIQLAFTNTVQLSDTRFVLMAPPCKITGLANDNQLVIWDSAPGINYQVYATTNLTYPLLPISPVIPASGTSTFYFDTSPSATNKFFRVQVVP